MDTKKQSTPKKKGLWALMKASMTKTSSGCGPGCSCHSEEPDTKVQKSASDTDRAKDNA